MYPLLETIRFENGKFSNAAFHFERMKRSAKDWIGEPLRFDPAEVLHEALELMENKTGLFKFRLLYDYKDYNWEFVPYTLPHFKTLKLVVDNRIEYSYKFSDRSRLARLTSLKENADDVLIIKNNEVTDTSFANVLFFDGNRWITPKHPLLPGTQRAFLLEKGIISEAVIKPDDIPAFQKVRIINAMIRMEDKMEVTITL